MLPVFIVLKEDNKYLRLSRRVAKNLQIQACDKNLLGYITAGSPTALK
jgi:hypothetical protein